MRIESSEGLAKRLKSSFKKIDEQKLPGFNEMLSTNEKAREAFMGKFDDVDAAMKDVDEILFERALNGLLNICWKINSVIAETYRKEVENPEDWDLRYIRFMKIKFIKFECKLGVFYLVPFIPRITPKAPHWFTVEEMIDMVSNPLMMEAMLRFGGLPVRPESLKGPEPGEKHMLIDFMGGDMKVKYELGKMT